MKDKIKQLFVRAYHKLKQIDHKTYILLAIFSVCLVLSIILFTSSYQRTWISLKGFFESFLFIFKYPKDTDFTLDTIVWPLIPNDPTASELTIPLTLRELSYTFKSWAVIILNSDFFVVYSFKFLSFLVRLLRFLIFIPYIVIFWMLIKVNVLREEESTLYTESKALVKYKAFELKYLDPIKSYFESWRIYLKYDVNELFTLAFIFLFLFSYRFVAMGIDFISSYLVFTRSFNFSRLPILLGSLLIDVVVILLEYPKVALLIPLFIFIIIRRHRTGQKLLKKMNEYNKEEQASHGVSNAISGPPGTGKTELMTSLGFLANESFINLLYEKIKKFNKMFPDFPFTRLEDYVRDGISERLFVNRAQIKRNIKDLYNNDQDGFAKLFDYDLTKKKIIHFDGIKFYKLDRALAIYAESFFLYEARKPLHFPNYAVVHHYDVKGHFAQYDFDVILRDKERGQKNNALILDFNDTRPYNQVGLTIVDAEGKRYLIDGGVITITEIDKERGNRFTHIGLRREALEANQLNDGFNDYMKMIRHMYTIDSTPFICVYSDTQRTFSVNADLRELNEGRIEIQKRSEEKVVFPLFELDYFIFGSIANGIDKYIYEFRSLRKDQTLYNYLLYKIGARAGNYVTKLYNLYGYSILSYKYRQNVTSDSPGETSDRAYYMINQITRADNYATDAYSEYFENLRMEAKEGFHDAKPYKTHRASVKELDAQHSYFINKVKDMTKTVVEDDEEE